MKFKKFKHSRLTDKQITQIEEKYLGKLKKTKFPNHKEKKLVRDKRWCDLDYQTAIQAASDLCIMEFEYMTAKEYQEQNANVAEHWVKIMSNWIEESRQHFCY